MRGIIYAAFLAVIPPCLSTSYCTLPPTSDISSDDVESLQQSLSSLLEQVRQSNVEFQSMHSISMDSYMDDFHVKSDTVIANSLEEDELNHWGFVVYRCTYVSQARWDKFIALVKEAMLNSLERWGTGDQTVYDKLTWTVIEDAETLDAASILDTSRRFEAWVATEGKEETGGRTGHAPRYHYFIHVDEESLESVVDDEKAARQRNGYFCTVVYPSSVMIREKGRLAGETNQDPLDEQVELLDSKKKIKLNSLVELYRTLVSDINSWYNIYVDIGDDKVPGTADV